MIRKRNFFEHKRVLLILFFIFILAQVIFFGSQYFTLKKVTVQGNKYIGNEELMAAANLELGVNAFLFPAKKAEARLKALPRIKSAKVKISLPSCVSIVVVERTPFLMVTNDSSDTTWYGADDEGVVIEKNPVEKMKDLPILIVGRDIKVGDRIPPEYLTIYSGLLSKMFAEEVEQISWVRIDPEEGLSYNYSDIDGNDRVVRLGDLSGIDQKFRILRKYIELEGKKDVNDREQIEMIDLAHDPPVVKLKSNIEKKSK